MRNEEATKRKITNFPKPHNDINSIMTFYDYDVTQFSIMTSLTVSVGYLLAGVLAFSHRVEDVGPGAVLVVVVDADALP